MFFWGFDDMDLRVAFVRGMSPRDFYTMLARWVVFRVTDLLALILYPVDLAVRFIGRVLPVEFLFVPALIWFPLWGLLVGTSWLWMVSIRARPFLLLPGIVLAIFSFIYLMLVPDSKKGLRYPAMAGEWPLTWSLWRPPWEYMKDSDYFEGQEYVGGLEEWQQRLKEKAKRMGPTWSGPARLGP